MYNVYMDNYKNLKKATGYTPIVLHEEPIYIVAPGFVRIFLPNTHLEM